MSRTLSLSAGNATALRSGVSRIVVIGPSGWLGSAALAMLDAALPGADLGEQVRVFGSRARPILLPSGRICQCQALAELGSDDLGDDVILHFGYLTKDKTAAMSLDDYVAANEAIQNEVLRAVTTTRPRGLFFASSGGVYQGKVYGAPTREDNVYGWMKLRHEEQFETATAESGTALINGRIFSLAGEHINKLPLYALGSFLLALKEGQPIRLTATREVWRSYTYVGDVINFALALLLKGRSAKLDIAGDLPIEVGELARLCAEVTGNPGAVITRPPMTDMPPDRMIGDAAEYLRHLRGEGIEPLPLAQQVAATAAFIQSS
jgi:UDP-glucuronate decarboxylase